LGIGCAIARAAGAPALALAGDIVAHKTEAVHHYQDLEGLLRNITMYFKGVRSECKVYNSVVSPHIQAISPACGGIHCEVASLMTTCTQVPAGDGGPAALLSKAA
jgi:hypothetical protein